jgi:hypothetical protein
MVARSCSTTLQPIATTQLNVRETLVAGEPWHEYDSFASILKWDDSVLSMVHSRDSAFANRGGEQAAIENITQVSYSLRFSFLSL